MARTPTLVPGLHKVDLPEVRQAIPALHAYLRQCALVGAREVFGSGARA